MNGQLDGDSGLFVLGVLGDKGKVSNTDTTAIQSPICSGSYMYRDVDALCFRDRSWLMNGNFPIFQIRKRFV